MARANIPSDCTFRFSHTGAMVISRQVHTVLGICHRMFHMLPERDIYNTKGMGLAIGSRIVRTGDGAASRDRELEREIVEQFNNYTDIHPLNVIAYCKNGALVITMDAQYGAFSFQMTTSSDPTLSTEILPKEIRGINQVRL